MNNISITHVVAIDNQRCIGKNNQLAWHIPADLQHFKRITSGGIVLMGRKTFESIGRPLPNRINHVITRDTTWQADGVTISHSLDEAIIKAKQDALDHHQSTIFIIGGGDIYHQSLSQADTLEITHVNLAIDGDAYYPEFTTDFQEIGRSETFYHTDAKQTIDFYFARYQRI